MAKGKLGERLISMGIITPDQLELALKEQKRTGRIRHKRWVDDYLENGKKTRDDKWTKSIAVGSKGFVDKVKSILGALASGRKCIEGGESYQLREPSVPYNVHFGGKKSDIGSENTYFWNVKL